MAIARENAARHDVSNRIRFLESDLLAAVTGETFDAIVSNPPYVAESEILEPQVSNFEPPIALYAGRYGLDIHQRLIPQAEKALKPDGLLLMEIGHNQSEDLIELLHLGFASDFAYDLQGIPRVAIGLRL